MAARVVAGCLGLRSSDAIVAVERAKLYIFFFSLFYVLLLFLVLFYFHTIFFICFPLISAEIP